MGTLLRFSESYCPVVSKACWPLKKEEIVKMAIFVLFSIL